MQKILLMISVLGSLQAATLSLELKQGWQLVGIPTSLDINTTFRAGDAEVVWAFDAESQSWQGYAADAERRSKIEENYTLLQEIKPYQALWVFSENDWILQYETQEATREAANRSIPLQTGWNLVSLPQEIVVSDTLFGDALVYKYSADQAWQSNRDDLGLPSIAAINESEGLWVKSEREQSVDLDVAASKLHTFSSRDAMLAYIREMISMQQYRYGDVHILLDQPMALAEDDNAASDGAAEDATTENATTTNLQEAGVDESDILKHNGQYIFNVAQDKVLVTSFSRLAAQSYVPITSIDFPDQNIVALYLQDERLVVISHRSYNYYGIEEPVVLAPENNSLPDEVDESRYEVAFYDVSDIDHIRRVAVHSISGNYEESRLIAGKLFVVSQFRPEVEYEYPHIYVESSCTIESLESFNGCVTPNIVDVADAVTVSAMPEQTCDDEWFENACYLYQYDEKGAYRLDYENPIIVSENLTPTITSNDAEAVEMLEPERFFAPSRLDQSSTITTLSSFSIAEGDYEKNSAFIGDTHTYYASQTALYLLSDQYPLYYDYIHYKEQQMIYSFALDANLSYRGKGAVEGRMLNQFSMSEYQDYLRVATTSGWAWWNGGETKNSVYTLSLIDQALEITGTLQGLGHEGERIRAVRFMGDRGFVVTFRQTDPLYTLDLSVPTAPAVVGELRIPGFSSYLHLVDENRVLSVGRDADATGRVGALQFQLFDISDFANPRLADVMRIGDGNSYSEAEFNHKAFAYRRSDMMFGVPYQNYSSYGESSEHFGIYQIDGMSIVSRHDISLANSNWGDVGRGVIFDLNSTSYGAMIKGEEMVCEPIEGANQ